MYTLEVLNPVAPVLGEVNATPMASRPSKLNGKTVGLIWNGKANGDVALRRIGDAIQSRVPDVAIKFYSGALPTPAPILERAKQEVDVAVGCTAD